MHIPTSRVPSQSSLPQHDLLSRYYHPAMADGAVLGAKGIALIIICIVLFISSLIVICYCCVLKKRWRRQETQDIELKELAIGQVVARQEREGAQERKSEEWEKQERRKRYYEGKEKAERAKKKAKEEKEAGRVGIGRREDMKDGFGRTVDGFGKVQVPERTQTKDWKMWHHCDGPAL